jgi:hypothetical protein
MQLSSALDLASRIPASGAEFEALMTEFKIVAHAGTRWLTVDREVKMATDG